MIEKYGKQCWSEWVGEIFLIGKNKQTQFNLKTYLMMNEMKTFEETLLGL